MERIVLRKSKKSISTFITTHYTNGSRFIWRSDGTTSGTYQIPFEGQPSWIAASGPYVYFNGTSQKYGSELYLIDESVSGASEDLVQIVSETTAEPLTYYPNPFKSDLSVNVKGLSIDRLIECADRA